MGGFGGRDAGVVLCSSKRMKLDFLKRVKKGLLLGVAVLLVVDVLWVGSAGLTKVS